MNETTTTLVGTIGRDPVMRTGPKGEWATFSVATSPRWRGQDGSWADGPTSWFDVKANGELGRNVVTSLRKGHRVVVCGTVHVREVSREDGTKMRFVEVQANAVGPNLTFGTTQFSRTGGSARESAPAPQPAAPSGAVPEPQAPTPAGSGWSTDELDSEVEVPF